MPWGPVFPWSPAVPGECCFHPMEGRRGKSKPGMLPAAKYRCQEPARSHPSSREGTDPLVGSPSWDPARGWRAQQEPGLEARGTNKTKQNNNTKKPPTTTKKTVVGFPFQIPWHGSESNTNTIYAPIIPGDADVLPSPPTDFVSLVEHERDKTTR